MVKNTVKELIVRTVLRILEDKECLIFLFGSQLNKVIPSSSDIDVGLLSEGKIDDHKLALIKNELAEKAKTLRKIDIIDFGRVDDSVFLENALRRIKIWHQTAQSKTYLNNLMKHSIA
jgi:predicted nucleotidyltransferase